MSDHDLTGMLHQLEACTDVLCSDLLLLSDEAGQKRFADDLAGFMRLSLAIYQLFETNFQLTEDCLYSLEAAQSAVRKLSEASSVTNSNVMMHPLIFSSSLNMLWEHLNLLDRTLLVLLEDCPRSKRPCLRN